MRRSWCALVALALVLACVGQSEAQPATVAGPEAKALAAIRSRLSAPAGAAAEDALARVRALAVIVGAPVDPSATLAAVRVELGAAPQPPSPGDAQEVGFIQQVLAALGQPAAPAATVAAITFPRKSGHPDPNVLEHSHMYFGLHGMLFEAQIAPNLFFFDNRQRTAPGSTVDLGIYSTDEGQARWAISWSFTPMVRLRNRSDTSSPIKTLSWMPKTDLQVIRLRRDAPLRATMLTLHGTVGHHSNGQDECTFQPGTLDREDLCAEPARPQDVLLNYPNGSFSTNYVRVGGVWKRLTLIQLAVDPKAYVRRTYAFGLYGETHPPGLKIGGTLPPVLRDLYGRNRLRGQGEFETRVGSLSPQGGGLFKGSVRLTGWLEYIDKVAPGVPATFTRVSDTPLNELYQPNDGSSRWRFGFEAAWNPDWLRGWGLEARYDHGQDYYNTLFARDIHWFQAGIVFDAAEFQPFKKQ